MAANKFTSSVPDPQLTLDSHQEVLKALKSNVEVLTQQRNPKSAAAVTWNDLVALGLIKASQVPT
jgi:hypothetical protein